MVSDILLNQFLGGGDAATFIPFPLELDGERSRVAAFAEQRKACAKVKGRMIAVGIHIKNLGMDDSGMRKHAAEAIQADLRGKITKVGT